VSVGSNTLSGVTAFTNAGSVSIAGGKIGATTFTNSAGGTITATGSSTITGALTNSGGVVLSSSVANQLNVGAFTGGGGTIAIAFDAHTSAGQASVLNVANGVSGNTLIAIANSGGTVTLGNALHVVTNGGGSSNLSASFAPNQQTQFGLVNFNLAQGANGGVDITRNLNTSVAAAPGGSFMAALAAIDTSFHQSTAPFVASPQATNPDTWTGGVWSRATTGQTTIKSTAFESLGGQSAGLRVKTNFDAYEVGIDTGRLNFGGTGWNGHFGVTGGAVMATSNEQSTGTNVKFEIPSAGVYGVLTHGPFFMDLEYRHDWLKTNLSSVTANLMNAPLNGQSDSWSGSAGYHIPLIDDWFLEPSAGFAYTQTGFGTLTTNMNQAQQHIAQGSITFDTLSSLLAHAGARVGTSVNVADTLALQPFATLSVWREFEGQSSATFSQAGGLSDPFTLSRVGTFYQAGVGVSAAVANTGLVGFVRGDLRWGDNLDGASLVGGLRYTFGP
jgi:outer membrane autotransporter protein